MPRTMLADLSLILPELFLTGGAVCGLLLGSYLPRRSQWLVDALAGVVCVAGVVATVVGWPNGGTTVFEGAYALDVATAVVRIVVLVSVLLVLAISGEFRGHARKSEFVVLLLLSALGTIVLAGANDLLLLVAAFLLASVPLYALTGFAKDSPGTEATMKYYLLSALAGTVMLFGVMAVFGVGGSTGYARLAETLPTTPAAAVAAGAVLVLAGPMFKAGAVPVHFWVPDVTQGARPPVSALVTTIPKIGALVAVYRLVATVLAPTALNWPLLVAVVAATTMTLGNLAAFFQDNVRRLLAYSTISQVGYLLMAVAAAGASTLALPSLLLYLAAYAVTNLGAFAVVAALPNAETLTDYRGLVRRHPWLAISLVVCLLGLVGTPPTGVFAGKLTVFTAAFDAGFGWLVAVAIANTVASLFYYLRWIAPAVRPEPLTLPTNHGAAGAAAVAAAVSLALGPLAGLVLAPLGHPLTPLP